MAALNSISADFIDILPLTLCNSFMMRKLQNVIAFGGAMRMWFCLYVMPGLHKFGIINYPLDRGQLPYSFVFQAVSG